MRYDPTNQYTHMNRLVTKRDLLNIDWFSLPWASTITHNVLCIDNDGVYGITDWFDFIMRRGATSYREVQVGY